MQLELRMGPKRLQPYQRTHTVADFRQHFICVFRNDIDISGFMLLCKDCKLSTAIIVLFNEYESIKVPISDFQGMSS